MLSSLITETTLALLVVGLGGGSLPLFVHDHFPKSCVDAVEIDPSMLEVATRWFGFAQSERMKVHIADGLDYITSLAGGEGAAGGAVGGRREGGPRVSACGLWGSSLPGGVSLAHICSMNMKCQVHPQRGVRCWVQQQDRWTISVLRALTDPVTLPLPHQSKEAG